MPQRRGLLRAPGSCTPILITSMKNENAFSRDIIWLDLFGPCPLHTPQWGEPGSKRSTGKAFRTVKTGATVVQHKSAGSIVHGFKHFPCILLSLGVFLLAGIGPWPCRSLTRSLMDVPVPSSFVSEVFLFCSYLFSSVQLLSHIQLFVTPWTTAHRLPCPSPTLGAYSNSCPLSRWCHPTISYSVVPFSSRLQFITSIRVFSNESVLRITWPKYWSFSLNISPSNEHPALISFRIDWLDLLAVQGTFKSLPQYHSLKASILRHSAFFIVQLSHPYMTTGKTKALTRRTFVDKVISLLFNMLSRLVITFLPRSKHLLISWLQSPSAVILEPPKIKSAAVSTVSPSISHEVMGPDAMIFVFWMLSF